MQKKTGTDICLCVKLLVVVLEVTGKPGEGSALERDAKLVAIQKAMYVKLSRRHIGILLGRTSNVNLKAALSEVVVEVLGREPSTKLSCLRV